MSDDVLVYPEGRVVGIAESREVLAAASEALRAKGIGPERCEVLTGPEAAQAADPDPGAHGVIAGAVRIVQHALGEETTRLAALSEALDAGAHVLLVELAEDDEQHQAEKDAAGKALIEAGVSQVAYYGSLAIEELQLGS